jgi:hypothetical protein
MLSDEQKLDSKLRKMGIKTATFEGDKWPEQRKEHLRSLIKFHKLEQTLRSDFMRAYAEEL